jgi:hypothetical protein
MLISRIIWKRHLLLFRYQAKNAVFYSTKLFQLFTAYGNAVGIAYRTEQDGQLH